MNESRNERPPHPSAQEREPNLREPATPPTTPTPTAGPEGAPRWLTTAEAEEQAPPLIADTEAQDFRERWERIQAQFVDEPRQAVARADQLLDEVVRRVTDAYARARQDLAQQWNRGEQADTESLRVALRRYRSLFDRLMSA